MVLESVDSYGHLIVSKLDTGGKDMDRLTYSVLPQDCGVGEGCWSGFCFSPSQWSMMRLRNSKPSRDYSNMRRYEMSRMKTKSEFFVRERNVGDYRLKGKHHDHQNYKRMQMQEYEAM